MVDGELALDDVHKLIPVCSAILARCSAANSRLPSMVAMLSKLTVPHSIPISRLMSMLALQNPAWPSSRGKTLVLNASTAASSCPAGGRAQVTRAQAPAGDSWSRWRIAISHSWTSRPCPPIVSSRRCRTGWSCWSAARMAASESHELVAMQRPLDRSTSIDSPRQPSMSVIIDISSLLTSAIPSSMRSRWAMMVVERARCVHGPSPFSTRRRPGGVAGTSHH